MARARARAAAPAVVDGALPEEGAHYYVDGDATHEILKCLVVLDDGRAVMATSGKAVVVDAADLRPVPTTVGDVLKIVGGLRTQLASGKPLENDDALTAIEAWLRGVPAPAAEKV